jgi:outer membrane protein assembly factor BamB
VASHTVGTFQVRIRNSGGGQMAEEIWRNKNVKTNITTPVLIEGHLYGLGTSRGKNSDFVCLNHKTGELVWSRKGYDDYASVIGMSDMLLVHGSRGALTLLKATPGKYTELGRIEKASQLSWNHPAYSGGVLFVKDGLRGGGNKLTALKLQ